MATRVTSCQSLREWYHKTGQRWSWGTLAFLNTSMQSSPTQIEPSLRWLAGEHQSGPAKRVTDAVPDHGGSPPLASRLLLTVAARYSTKNNFRNSSAVGC